MRDRLNVATLPRYARRPSPPGQAELDLRQQASFALDEAGRFEKARREYQDSTIDLRRIQEGITRKGGVVREDADARLAETLYKGRVKYAIDTFRREHYDPLKRAMTVAKISVDELDEYLHARHAESRNREMRKINDYYAAKDTPRP